MRGPPGHAAPIGVEVLEPKAGLATPAVRALAYETADCQWVVLLRDEDGAEIALDEAQVARLAGWLVERDIILGGG